MERQKARWRKSEDGPDVEKIVTFYVALISSTRTIFFMWQFLFAT